MEGWVRKLNVRFKSETGRDRKSTRLNSSHDQISYAVFCLKKKKKSENRTAHVWTPVTLRELTPSSGQKKNMTSTTVTDVRRAHSIPIPNASRRNTQPHVHLRTLTT